MNRMSTAAAAGAAFLTFAVIYLLIAAATVGLGGAQWAVAIIGGLVFAGVAAAIAVAVDRRRGGR